MLINAIKDVAKALSDLIGATKGAASKPADDPSMYQLKGAAKVRGKNCSSLLSLSQVAHRSFGFLSQILLLPTFPELANNCLQLFKARAVVLADLLDTRAVFPPGENCAFCFSCKQLWGFEIKLCTCLRAVPGSVLLSLFCLKLRGT